MTIIVDFKDLIGFAILGGGLIFAVVLLIVGIIIEIIQSRRK